MIKPIEDRKCLFSTRTVKVHISHPLVITIADMNARVIRIIKSNNEIMAQWKFGRINQLMFIRADQNWPKCCIDVQQISRIIISRISGAFHPLADLNSELEPYLQRTILHSSPMPCYFNAYLKTKIQSWDILKEVIEKISFLVIHCGKIYLEVI